MSAKIKLAELVKSDAEAFGYFEAAKIAQKKRKLTFQQTYMMLFGKYPKAWPNKSDKAHPVGFFLVWPGARVQYYPSNFSKILYSYQT